jgi:protein SCO1/2
MILACSKNKISVLFVLLFVVLLPLGVHAHVPGAPREFPPTSATPNTKAPAFVLLNQDGNRFDSTSLRGKVVVLNFIFTTCTDVCPLFTANFAQLQRTLKNEEPALFLVSITTDPEVDSPKVLKAYAQRYGADFRNWAFLTGSESQLKPVWKAFDVRVIKKGRGLVQHTSLTTLIDRQGIRRFNFFGEKWPLKDLLRDTSALLEEKPKPTH